MHYSWLQRILLYKSPVAGYLIFYTTGMSLSFVHIDKHLEIISKSEIAFLTNRVCSILKFFDPNLFAKSSSRKNLNNEGITPRPQAGAKDRPSQERAKPGHAHLCLHMSSCCFCPTMSTADFNSCYKDHMADKASKIFTT